MEDIVEVESAASTNDVGGMAAEFRRDAENDGIELEPEVLFAMLADTGTGVAFEDLEAASPFLLEGFTVVTPLTLLMRDAFEYARGLFRLDDVPAVVERE